VDRDVGLFVTADVGCGGTDADVSVESEEGEDDEEDTAFKDSGFEKWMFWSFQPSLKNMLGFSLSLCVGTVSGNNIVKSLVVTLFVQLIR
jgi:hypothetical protein